MWVWLLGAPDLQFFFQSVIIIKFQWSISLNIWQFFSKPTSPWAIWTSSFVRPHFRRHTFIDPDLDPVDRCKVVWWGVVEMKWCEFTVFSVFIYITCITCMYIWKTVNIDMYTQYIQFIGKIHISVPRGLNRLFLGTKLPTSTGKKSMCCPEVCYVFLAFWNPFVWWQRFSCFCKHAAGYSGELQAAVGNLAEAHEPHRLPTKSTPNWFRRQADVAMGVMSGPLSPVNPKTGKTVSIMAVDCMLAGRGPVLSEQVAIHPHQVDLSNLVVRCEARSTCSMLSGNGVSPEQRLSFNQMMRGRKVCFGKGKLFLLLVSWDISSIPIFYYGISPFFLKSFFFYYWAWGIFHPAKLMVHSPRTAWDLSFFLSV